MSKLEITSQSIMTRANKKTEKHLYTIEGEVSNSELISANVNVSTIADNEYVGNITMNNGQISSLFASNIFDFEVMQEALNCMDELRTIAE